ncbi:unnamed protein product [Phyllotreta striolata]|uniref:Uncharacterized protein n=1 Tax=Phyllotreta striolata TaxID=444603 RepID=A0A9N9TSF7_PHYSR|nr:unnamed protein product [Phyllotreta striolata]
MQQIISMEVGKGRVESSRYITKRLCCSLLLTVAFLSMIGGFFLGKFVSDRTNSQYRQGYRELTGKVDALNVNFVQLSGNRSGNLAENASFFRCNFSTIGHNDSGKLTATNYLSKLNHCFDSGVK